MQRKSINRLVSKKHLLDFFFSLEIIKKKFFAMEDEKKQGDYDTSSDENDEQESKDVASLTHAEAMKIVEEENRQTIVRAQEILTMRRARRRTARQPQQPVPRAQTIPIEQVSIASSSNDNSGNSSLPPMYPSHPVAFTDTFMFKAMLTLIVIMAGIILFPNAAAQLGSGAKNLMGFGEVPERSKLPAHLNMYTENLVITTHSTARELSLDEILSHEYIQGENFDMEYLRKSMRHAMETNGFTSICAVHFKIPIDYCMVLRADNISVVEMFNTHITEKALENRLHSEASIYCKHPEYFVNRAIYIVVDYYNERGIFMTGAFQDDVAGDILANIDLNRGIIPCALA
jgi:hypothetical protein